VLVGGTGLYLRTLLDGIAPVPEIPPAIRSEVRAMTTAEAFGWLENTDPVLASRLHPNDDSRIKRGLEVVRGTGHSLLEWRDEKVGGIADTVELMPVLVLPPRDWLHARCDTRFASMLDDGAIGEVAALLDRNLPAQSPLMRAIGVGEITAMLNGEITRDQAILLGQAATRQYAKRQYTWFRNQTSEHWPRFEREINNSNMSEIVTLFQ
jgi:tRNA dimethylallyltransferase